MNDKFKKYFSIIFLIFLSLGTVFPLFHGGFFPMHDDTQVARVFEMTKSLRDGMFPVRWVADLGYGYGYPIFNFYAPFAYYVGGVISILTSALLATKIMIIFAMLASGITMFFLGNALWGKWGGILSAVLYVFAPYHAVDLYVRGDIAELWAYAFFPLAILGVWFIYKKPSVFAVLVGSIGFAGVVISHNLSAFLFAPFLLVLLFIAVLFAKNKKISSLSAISLLILGFLLSAWYTLPVFAEMRYTNVLSQIGGGADFHDHFVCLSQLWQSQWGYGGSVSGCTDGLSFMIGKLQIIFGLLGLFAAGFMWKKSREKMWLVIICSAAVLVSVFLLLPYSTWLWNMIPQMAFLQYPWRYLLMACLFLSIAAGSVAVLMEKLPNMGKVVLVMMLSVGIAGFSLKYFQPQQFLDVQSGFYTNKEQLAWNTSKISDEYMPIGFHKPQSVKELPTQLVVVTDGTARIITSKTQKHIVSVQAVKQTQVKVNLAYFPGWQATLDGKLVTIQPVSTGFTVSVPPGLHKLVISFKQTPVELAGDWISLASIGIVIIGILYARKRKA